MNAKKEGTPATLGMWTSEGTITSGVTVQAEGMLTLAGPQQQQKSQ
jgi:hypothetical protein